MHPEELSIKVGQKDYVFSALNLKDAEDLTIACKFYGYQQAKQAGLTQQELNAALNHCVDYSPTEEQVQSYLIRPAGQIETLYLSLVKRQPKITRAEVKAMFADLANSLETVEAIVNFIGKASHPDPTPEQPGN